jgi:hydroxyacylglutathione hydrolase
MTLQQLYLQSLGHAAYLVGSEQTGEALVLEALVLNVCRDVDVYFAAARQHGMRLRCASPADTVQPVSGVAYNAHNW